MGTMSNPSWPEMDLCMVLCVPLECLYYLLVQWQVLCWVVAFHNTDKSLQQQKRLKVQSVKLQQTDSQTEKINYTKLLFFASDFVPYDAHLLECSLCYCCLALFKHLQIQTMWKSDNILLTVH